MINCLDAKAQGRADIVYILSHDAFDNRGFACIIKSAGILISKRCGCL